MILHYFLVNSIPNFPAQSPLSVWAALGVPAWPRPRAPPCDVTGRRQAATVRQFAPTTADRTWPLPAAGGPVCSKPCEGRAWVASDLTRWRKEEATPSTVWTPTALNWSYWKKGTWSESEGGARPAGCGVHVGAAKPRACACVSPAAQGRSPWGRGDTCSVINPRAELVTSENSVL